MKGFLINWKASSRISVRHQFLLTPWGMVSKALVSVHLVFEALSFVVCSETLLEVLF